MSSGPLAFETAKPVAAPAVVMRTIRSARGSVSQRAPPADARPSCSPPGVSPFLKIVHGPSW